MERIDKTINRSGLVTEILTSELDGAMHVAYKQDLEPHIEYATALRNNEQYTREGIKKGMMHAAHIPDVVIVELKQIGVDVFTASAREIIAGIRRLGKDYLLTTRARI